MAFDYTFKSLKKVMSVSIAPDSYKLGGISASDYATNTYLNSNFIKGLSADGTTLTITKGDNSTSTVTVNASGGGSLPSQTNNAGKFLTTDGTNVSWATVDTLPSQTNNSGKFLTTNGSSASWSTVEALPSQTNNSGKFLTTNGSTASWEALTNIDVVVNPTASSTTISLSEYSDYVNSDGSNILVFRDGFKQIADMDYTFSNNTLTFELAFVSNETVSVLISSAIGVIIDGEQVSY